MTGGFKKLKRHLDRIYFDKPASYQSNILGIILIIIGIIFLYNPTPHHLKIGGASILIGIFMIFIITGKTTAKGITDIQITLIITAWILVMFYITGITGKANLEMFFILIFIGFLIVKELTYEFTAVHVKNRMNVFISMFIIVFIVIITKKIISIAGI